MSQILQIIKQLLNKKHKHKFVSVKWNKEKYGKDFTPTDLYAEYKWLYRCENCGEERVKVSYSHI